MEERKALVYAMLHHLQQQRALVYHSILTMCREQEYGGVKTLQILDEQINFDEYEMLQKQPMDKNLKQKLEFEFD